MPNPTLFLEDDLNRFWQSAKNDVLLCIRETLETYETCRIGLAGGSTPKHLYEMLADEDLPWDKITWIQIDERYVPSDSPESNLRMLRASLFKKASIAPDQIIAFDTSLPPESAVKEMGRKLIALTHERFPIFDLLILGVGADGHIASLFEEDKEALTSANYATMARASGMETEQRLSLSILSLKSADRALILLKGEAKKPVYQALENPAPHIPMTALREVMETVPTKVLANF